MSTTKVHGSPVYQGTIVQTDCVYYLQFLGLLMRKRRRRGEGGEESIFFYLLQQMEQQKSIALKH